MIFNKHSELEGRHAFFSPSQFRWIYDESVDDLLKRFKSYWAATVGTEVHAFANLAISNRKRLLKAGKDSLHFYLLSKRIPEAAFDIDFLYDNLYMYVNDAIALGMTPEQKVYYSDACFGTADAISFENNELRIHDLKTGVTPVHMEQLEVYTSYFCLEHHIDPSTIYTELRIYQSSEVITHIPDPDGIKAMMDKIVELDAIYNEVIRKGY